MMNTKNKYQVMIKLLYFMFVVFFNGLEILENYQKISVPFLSDRYPGLKTTAETSSTLPTKSIVTMDG